jgi:hypothetical protein
MAISGLMSPMVPMLDKTMRKKKAIPGAWLQLAQG